MEKKTINVNGKNVEINNEDFVLVTNPNASFKDYGWDFDYVETLLRMEACGDETLMSDDKALNNLGIIYSDAIGVDRNMQKAVLYFGSAADLGNDLARSNLADIYRKGSHGFTLDHHRAFNLYKACKLPYAYYRVGEYYENGLAGIQDLKLAKENYRIAYEAGHGLARKKLQTFNFLAD